MQRVTEFAPNVLCLTTDSIIFIHRIFMEVYLTKTENRKQYHGKSLAQVIAYTCGDRGVAGTLGR